MSAAYVHHWWCFFCIYADCDPLFAGYMIQFTDEVSASNGSCNNNNNNNNNNARIALKTGVSGRYTNIIDIYNYRLRIILYITYNILKKA